MNVFDVIFRLLGLVQTIKVLAALVSVCSALLTPTIGAIAVYIAYQQHVTNRRQLRLALFDRRLRVFNSTASLIAGILQRGRVEHNDLFAFLRETRECDFLFGPDIAEYIKLVYEKGLRVHAEFVARDHDLQDRVELMNWFSGQMEEAKKKFGKYMAFPESL